ncbi:hypothetical protein [Parvularcula maris]|uniref:TMhelix containing protein n=1 Tax=Parvularcula maris TaxID=2965077 RepID=A0A9X2RIM0_9PROT|nr:hypothetical protein [Parvularcula maris]MCQ8186149.1 hypothetical protein [Parvularcula maris]
MALNGKIVATTLGVAALFGTANAFSINDDMRSCKAAIDEAGLFGDAEYNLDLVKDYGKRNRVVTLEARIVGQENQIVECRMSRSTVKEVVIVAE